MHFNLLNNRILILAGVALLVTVGLLLLLVFLSQEKGPPSQEEIFQDALVQPTPIPGGEFDDMEVLATSDYHILYFGKTNEFLISITGTPFDRARNDAERALLQALNISEEKACTFLVTISTPLFANPQYAGQSFGLSFCD